MRPKQPKPTNADLFRMRFGKLLDRRHELVRLGALIDWNRFDEAFGPLYRDKIGCAGGHPVWRFAPLPSMIERKAVRAAPGRGNPCKPVGAGRFGTEILWLEAGGL